MIELNDAGDVVMDGVVAGKPLDAMVNHKLKATEIQGALTAWISRRNQAHANALRDAKAHYDGALARKDAEITTLQLYLDAVGGTEAGKQAIKEQRLVDIKAEKMQAADRIKQLEIEEQKLANELPSSP